MPAGAHPASGRGPDRVDGIAGGGGRVQSQHGVPVLRRPREQPQDHAVDPGAAGPPGFVVTVLETVAAAVALVSRYMACVISSRRLAYSWIRPPSRSRRSRRRRWTEPAGALGASSEVRRWVSLGTCVPALNRPIFVQTSRRQHRTVQSGTGCVPRVGRRAVVDPVRA